MELNNVTYVPSSGANQTATNSTELDRQAFLQLLVTQLQYQDPLEPAKSTDFIAQLAQFSSLEQMESMNSSLTSGLEWDYLLSQTISNTMATSLIGRSVRADSSQVYLETGGSSNVALQLDQAAAEITLTVRDVNGDAVRTITQRGLDAGDHTLHWDGLDDSGVQVAAGFYSVQITGVDANGNDITPNTFVEGKVEGVSYQDGMALLTVNGQNIPLGMVHEVREG